MSVDSEKKELRKVIQQKKRALSKEEQALEASVAFSQLESLSAFKEANHILLYWSLFDELNTQPFVDKWWKKKNIYLPRVVGEQVDVVPYKGLDSMVEGAFRILEPTGQPILNLQQIDLVIVPGVAFTTDGHRMGRGGGYYDRLLPMLSHVVKIGVCFHCQIVDYIPVEKHDIKMDAVLFASKNT